MSSSAPLQELLSTLDILQAKITNGYSPQDADQATIQQQMELHAATSEKGIYDAKFLEEKYPHQHAPKQRGQTLQEFVLLFFYISLGIFSVALIIFAFLENGQSYSEAAKMLGLCVFLFLAVTVILIRVA
jgi:hypothetical protein